MHGVCAAESLLGDFGQTDVLDLANPNKSQQSASLLVLCVWRLVNSLDLLSHGTDSQFNRHQWVGSVQVCEHEPRLFKFHSD